jgi:hypothetical protein
MSKPAKPKNPRNLPELLHEVEETKHAEVKGKPLDPRLQLLSDWQVQRLTRTHHDLLVNPRYQLASDYFIHDIYAARDFSQRNYDLRRMHDTFRRWLPELMIRPLTLAIELHELTEKLDAQLLAVLVKELGMTDHLNAEMYAKAYRLCNNYQVRVRQIELIRDIGKRVEGLVNFPFSATALKLGRGPAVRAGWGELMDFLERGYKAFKQMHGANYFLETILSRERHILERIYENDPKPFGFEMSLTLSKGKFQS